MVILIGQVLLQNKCKSYENWTPESVVKNMADFANFAISTVKNLLTI